MNDLDDDYEPQEWLREPVCIGSCDVCGADVYDDEPRHYGSIRCVKPQRNRAAKKGWVRL